VAAGRDGSAVDDGLRDVGTVHSPCRDLAGELQAAQVRIANLEVALQSARTIGAAMGILVERHKITADAAYAKLTSASQHLNRKLREVAEELVQTGELVDQPSRCAAASERV
jgi:AmiR/NasT family two-component response regulator